MKSIVSRFSLSLAAAVAGLCAPVAAEDIDLFTNPSGSQHNPNVVIMIDNSANWDAANQHWPGNIKQGQSELNALRTVVGELTNKLNLGLMLFTPGSGQNFNGAYVRFHVRPMNATNIAALQELIGTGTCTDGTNSLNGTANCIYKNFSKPAEKVGTAKTDYSASLFEVFKYFGGFTDPAHAHSDTPGFPTDSSRPTPPLAGHFGPFRYAGDPDPNTDSAAFVDTVTKNQYKPPQDSTNSCAKNFLVFIGNGFPNQDSPSSLLTGVNGNATILPIQNFTVTSTTSTSTLGTDAVCESASACATTAQTSFPGFDTYACSGGTSTPSPPVTIGTDNVCESNAACVTRAQGQAPGHVSYLCTGGTAGTTGNTTGTDLTCENVSGCNSRQSTILPGFTTYSGCSGGTSGSGTTFNLGTDPQSETIPACVTRVTGLYTGYTSYSCTGGTQVSSSAAVVGNSGLTCETATACATRMATVFPGHTSYTCTAGTATNISVGTDATCENATQCGNAAKALLAGAASGSCSGGTSCGTGGKLVGQAMTASCSGTGVAAKYTVTATDVTYSGMTMQGTGCSTGGKASGQTFTASNACTNNQTMQYNDTCLASQTMTGTKTVVTSTPSGVPQVPSSTTNRWADEWARYIYTADANATTGQQNITTYTIDVYKDAQDVNETALLQNMAKYGGGRYFRATDENAILNALRQILVEIQAVNSVFASASLPINATNRSQNENQVFIGMFRPNGTALPRWFGNLKRFQIALFGSDARLADKNGDEAIASTTGFIQACAASYYTVDSGTYWDFSPDSAGSCTSIANSTFSDLPDGGVVEKGSAAEVLRRGNSTTATAPFVVNRSMLTCTSSPCGGLVTFDDTNVTFTRTGAADAAGNTSIVNFTKGLDVLDENGNANVTEPRPSLHGDIAHSRPLPVNFGGSRAVEVYYGSNDGAFHALRGSNGTEKWSFIAPEHHSKLKRLYDNSPQIPYPNMDPNVVTQPKDYFFDGSAGLYQNDDSSRVWIYPSMRRGGRMIYALDISGSGNPTLKWVAGCPNTGDDTGCTSNMSGIGQTWSTPSIAFVKGYSNGTLPLAVFGGGYDACEDADNATSTCTSSNKGNKVFIVDADGGPSTLLKTFTTDRAVASDVTFVDRDFDGKVDHIYVADTGGGIYRIDLVDPVTLASKTSANWTMTKIAQTTGGSRKFLFGPSALATTGSVFLALGSGDRERPLISNYPFTTPVQNRFYMFIDKFATAGLPIDLDGSTMTNFTSSTDCNTTLDTSKTGWFMDLPGLGEQTVTSAVIFGGTTFFSTNRPVATATGSCANNLGEARGYAVNLLNASGVIGTGALCGGSRSGTFVGGGLPPSPVVGTVPVTQADGSSKPINVLIGGINLDTGTGSSIGAQEPPVPLKQIRSRIYWYPHGDK